MHYLLMISQAAAAVATVTATTPQMGWNTLVYDFTQRIPLANMSQVEHIQDELRSKHDQDHCRCTGINGPARRRLRLPCAR